MRQFVELVPRNLEEVLFCLDSNQMAFAKASRHLLEESKGDMSKFLVDPLVSCKAEILDGATTPEIRNQ